MPQLVKGGKYAFGWALVGTKGKILIPKEAYDEYEFGNCDKAILLPGSAASGGFALTKVDRLSKGFSKKILNFLNYSEDQDLFQLPELKLIEYCHNRYICWVNLNKNGYFLLSPSVMKVYGVGNGDRLLVVRGSGHALGFIVRGFIVQTAKKHPELKTFK